MNWRPIIDSGDEHIVPVLINNKNAENRMYWTLCNILLLVSTILTNLLIYFFLTECLCMHIKTAKRPTALSIVINLCYQEDLLGSFCSITENSLINKDLQTFPSANDAVQIAEMAAKLPKLKQWYLMVKNRSFYFCYSPHTVP